LSWYYAYIAWLVGINPEVNRAEGRPDINVKLLLLSVIYYIPVYVMAAPYGIIVFCFARIGVAIISMFLHFYFVNKILQFPFTYLWNCIKLPLLASVIMFIFIYSFINLFNLFYGWKGGLQITFIIIFGALIYIAAVWLFDKKFTNQAFILLKKSIH
jgi:hypothetical protein